MSNYSNRVITVLNRLIEIAEDEDEAKALSLGLDNMLDDLEESDFFGTEGQCDPRGDQRDGRWDISRVQGVDP